VHLGSSELGTTWTSFAERSTLPSSAVPRPVLRSPWRNRGTYC
jgi:hypothetical protein